MSICLKIISLLLVFFIHSRLADAGDHRELGPHEHGHGTLNIVIEETKVNMELEVSGNDILGFEHLPSNFEETEVFKKAQQTLLQPLEVFGFSSGSCKTTDANVNIEDEDGEEGKSTENKSHEHHSSHNQFHAEYSLTCSSIKNLKNITFEYFNLFQNAERLTVNVVTRKGQSKFEVSRDQKSLDISSLL